MHEAAYEFDSFCGDLTFNSKGLINSLTRISGENLHNAEAIVVVLEQRIYTSPPPLKLPFLYLVDSIMKNIGQPYVGLFCPILPNAFIAAYSTTPEDVRMSMQRLLNTWPVLFGDAIVSNMRMRAANFDKQYGHAQPQLTGLQSMPLVHPGPPVSAAGLLHQQRPPMPTGPPQHTQQFLHLQALMNQLMKDASMGISPSNHKVFSINSVISSLLQHPYLTPVERDCVQCFQQQLRDLSVPSRIPHSIAPPQPAAPPLSRAMPLATTAALSTLLSNPPPGLLSVSNPSGQPPPPLPAPSRGPPLRAVPAPSIPAVPRRPPPSTPVFASPMPTVLKFSDIKKFSHASAVRALYTDLPFLSKSDGMRFASQDKLREHLDWLFKRNRSKRAHERGLAEGGLSRCWYEKLHSFLNKDQGSQDRSPTGGNDITTVNDSGRGDTPTEKGVDRRKAGSIPAQSASEQCAACGEELDAFWDDEQESWMLKEATRMDEGVFHTKCMPAATDLPSEHRSASTLISPTKSEVDEPPAVDLLVKLESKPVPAPNTLAAEVKPSSSVSVVKQEEAVAHGTTASRESKQEVTIASSRAQKSVDTSHQLPVAEGSLPGHPDKMSVKQEIPAAQGKKRGRDDDVNSTFVSEGSPEKRVKV